MIREYDRPGLKMVVRTANRNIQAGCMTVNRTLVRLSYLRHLGIENTTSKKRETGVVGRGMELFDCTEDGGVLAFV